VELEQELELDIIDGTEIEKEIELEWNQRNLNLLIQMIYCKFDNFFVCWLPIQDVLVFTIHAVT